MTARLVEDPEQELERIDSREGMSDAELEQAFEKAAANEKERVKGIIGQRALEFEEQLGLKLYDERIDLIADQTLQSIADINSVFLDFKEMYHQVMIHNEGLFSQLGVTVTIADSAIDEIIRIAFEQDREISEICTSLASELEYGLKLVRDRIGFESFALTREAVIDPEKYIDSLIKQYYSHNPATT